MPQLLQGPRLLQDAHVAAVVGEEAGGREHEDVKRYGRTEIRVCWP